MSTVRRFLGHTWDALVEFGPLMLALIVAAALVAWVVAGA
jgi:hypothetical protein